MSTSTSTHLVAEVAIDSTDSEAAQKRHTYYGTQQDSEAVKAIRKKFGLSSDSEAIRFALRLVSKGVIQITVDSQVVPMGYRAR